MSLAALRRRRIIFASSEAPPPSSDDIELTYVATSGATMASNGLPLKPGTLTAAQIAAGKGVLFVNGSEVQFSLEPLKGKHVDASLVSVLLQAAVADVASGTVVFKPSATRTITMRSPVTITLGNLLDHARLLPMASSQYLCDTHVDLLPMVPVSQMTSTESAFIIGAFESRYDQYFTNTTRWEYYNDALTPDLDWKNVWLHAAASQGGQGGPAHYNPHGMLAKYFTLTLNTRYWQDGIRRCYQMARGLIPAAGELTDYYDPTGLATYLNPDGFTHTNFKNTGSEFWANMSDLGYTTWYWWTGCVNLRRAIVYRFSECANQNGNDYARWNSGGQSADGLGYIQQSLPARTAWHNTMYPAMCAKILEVAPSELQYTKYVPNTTYLFATILPFMLDASADRAWSGFGNYLDGWQPGSGQYTMIPQGGPPPQPISRTWMTAMWSSDLLTLYRYWIKDDSRILPIQIGCAERMYKNMRPAQSGDLYSYAAGQGQWAITYNIDPTGYISSGDLNMPLFTDYMPMTASTMAIWKREAGASQADAPYNAAWALYSVLGPDFDYPYTNWRVLGEFHHACMHGPAHRLNTPGWTLPTVITEPG